MLQELIQYSITYLQESGLPFLYRIGGAIGAYIVLHMVINKVVARIKTRIVTNAGQADQVYVQKIASLIGTIIFTILMIFAVLIIFQIIGFDMALLMGGISLGIGFALETTIGNMVAGVLILTNKKVKIGDFVKFLGSINTLGKIEEIHIRYTVVSTLDKRRLVIPNMKLAATPIQTFKTEPLVRGEIKTVIGRKYDIKKVKEMIKNIMNEQESVIFKNYTSVTITAFNSRGIELTGYFFVNPQGKQGKFVTAAEIRKNLAKAFKDNNITVTYQHVTLTAEE